MDVSNRWLIASRANIRTNSRTMTLRLLRLLLPAVVLGWLAPACATQHAPYNYAAEPDPRKKEYVLGPSDVLHVNVWRNPELSGDATVRPDGTISVPLVGDLSAAGRTPSQIRADIAQRMTAFIKDDAAIVTVAVNTIASYRFVVSGNVEHPGAFAAN